MWRSKKIRRKRQKILKNQAEVMNHRQAWDAARGQVCRWVTPGTPYNVDELAHARLIFQQTFENQPSNALLTLERKSQFARYGPRSALEIQSFGNDYFTCVQPGELLLELAVRDEEDADEDVTIIEAEAASKTGDIILISSSSSESDINSPPTAQHVNVAKSLPSLDSKGPSASMGAAKPQAVVKSNNPLEKQVLAVAEPNNSTTSNVTPRPITREIVHGRDGRMSIQVRMGSSPHTNTVPDGAKKTVVTNNSSASGKDSVECPAKRKRKLPQSESLPELSNKKANIASNIARKSPDLLESTGNASRLIDKGMKGNTQNLPVKRVSSSLSEPNPTCRSKIITRSTTRALNKRSAQLPAISASLDTTHCFQTIETRSEEPPLKRPSLEMIQPFLTAMKNKKQAVNSRSKEPPMKRPNLEKIQPIKNQTCPVTGEIDPSEPSFTEDSSPSDQRWKCDFCDFLTTKQKMLRHLKESEHYSASLCCCSRGADGLLRPIYVISASKMVEPAALGKSLIAVCPDPYCLRAFRDVYECSYHFAQIHGKLEFVNRYSIGSVLLENEIVFYPGKSCFCGIEFERVPHLIRHCARCPKFPDFVPLPHTFLVYVCGICKKLDRVFPSLFRGRAHMTKCRKRLRARTKSQSQPVNVRVLHVEKPTDWRLHLPNRYPEMQIQNEIAKCVTKYRRRGKPLTPAANEKIARLQSLKNKYKSFMKQRTVHYQKTV